MITNTKMREQNITEINITPIRPRNGLVAFSSFILNNNLYVGNVGIFTSPSSPDGFRLVYPYRVLGNGQKIDTVFPITKDFGYDIQRVVVEEYKRLINKLVTEDNSD